MTVFSICTAFVTQGRLEETIASMSTAEQQVTGEIGVLSRPPR